jgi:hypothetical protein
MFAETDVFCGDQSTDHMGRNTVVIGIDPVSGAEIVPAEFGGAVGGIYERGQFVVRILKFLDWRHVTNHSIVNEEHKEQNKKSKAKKRYPHPLHDAAVAFEFSCVSWLEILQFIDIFVTFLSHCHYASPSDETLSNANLIKKRHIRRMSLFKLYKK